jgi:hypothetical protein
MGALSSEALGYCPNRQFMITEEGQRNKNGRHLKFSRDTDFQSSYPPEDPKGLCR